MARWIGGDETLWKHYEQLWNGWWKLLENSTDPAKRKIYIDELRQIKRMYKPQLKDVNIPRE